VITRACKKGDPLTPSEIAVLERLAAGRGYKEIAQDLGVRPSTVSIYITTAKRKLGARTHHHFGYLIARAGIEPKVGYRAADVARFPKVSKTPAAGEAR